MPFEFSDASSATPKRMKGKANTANTELISARIPSTHIRLIDEYVAARRNAALRTRTDVLRDAVALWLEQEFEEGNLDTLSRLQFSLSKQRAEEERWSEVVEEISSRYLSLKNGPSYPTLKEELGGLIEDVRAIVDDCPIPPTVMALGELLGQMEGHYKTRFKR